MSSSLRPPIARCVRNVVNLLVAFCVQWNMFCGNSSIGRAAVTQASNCTCSVSHLPPSHAVHAGSSLRVRLTRLLMNLEWMSALLFMSQQEHVGWRVVNAASDQAGVFLC